MKIDSKKSAFGKTELKKLLMAKEARQILFVITAAALILMAGCAKEEDVEPKFTSLWDNVFSGCGVSCHSVDSTDGTEDGPDLSTKTNFYNNLYELSASSYAGWVNDGCANVNFIAAGEANQSALAAALVLSVSDSLGCDTAYKFHALNNSIITDSNTADALIQWINDGAENN